MGLSCDKLLSLLSKAKAGARLSLAKIVDNSTMRARVSAMGEFSLKIYIPY